MGWLALLFLAVVTVAVIGVVVVGVFELFRDPSVTPRKQWQGDDAE